MALFGPQETVQSEPAIEDCEEIDAIDCDERRATGEGLDKAEEKPEALIKRPQAVFPRTFYLLGERIGIVPLDRLCQPFRLDDVVIAIEAKGSVYLVSVHVVAGPLFQVINHEQPVQELFEVSTPLLGASRCTKAQELLSKLCQFTSFLLHELGLRLSLLRLLAHPFRSLMIRDQRSSDSSQARDSVLRSRQ